MLREWLNTPEALQSFLHETVPLAKAAEVSIVDYDGQRLVASAPLEKNINDKLTAFGGSLYNLCVSSAWCITHLKALELKLAGDIVVAKGEISYLRPLRSELVAHAFSPSLESLERASKMYEINGKASFWVESEIRDENGELCVQFKGKYAVVK